MRPQKVDDQQLLTGFMSVFRTKGYDGASLNELADATGLQKASLYHRYPGGKKDIALAVLGFVNQWIDRNIVEVLSNKNVTPQSRLLQVMGNINQLYDSGKSICILRSLSMSNSLDLFRPELKLAMNRWMDSFYQLGKEMGISDSISKEMAVNVLIKIQGSLVVAKTMDDLTIFKNVIKEIEGMYLKS